MTSYIKKEKTGSNSVIYVVAIIALLGGFYLFSGTSQNTDPLIPNEPVHWHATLSINVCGEEQSLPITPIKSHLLHTHEDRLIHIEGIIPDPESIMLGRYMNYALGLELTNTSVMGYRNEIESCNDGKDNTLAVLVDGTQIQDHMNHVIRDGQKIRILYE